MGELVTGVTSVVGVPSTHLVFFFSKHEYIHTFIYICRHWDGTGSLILPCGRQGPVCLSCNAMVADALVNQGARASTDNTNLLISKYFSFCTRRQGSTLRFLAGCPKSHFLGWYRNFLVYCYYIPRIRRIGGCYGFTSKPPSARRPQWC